MMLQRERLLRKLIDVSFRVLRLTVTTCLSHLLVNRRRITSIRYSLFKIKAVNLRASGQP